MKPGAVVIGVLVGAQETKVRPAVVIASATYLAERPDAVAGILTTKLPTMPGTTDYVLQDWQSAGLRAESCFRAYILTAHRSELTVIGLLSGRDWESVKARVRAPFALLTRLPFPIALEVQPRRAFICWGMEAPAMKRGKRGRGKKSPDAKLESAGPESSKIGRSQ